MGNNKHYLASLKSPLLVLAAVLTGIIVGYVVRGDGTGTAQSALHASVQNVNEESVVAELNPATPAAAQNEATVYVCPMNCVPPMQQPGKCPVCGMDLVAHDNAGHTRQEGPVRLHLLEDDVKAAGIQVAPVVKMAVSNEVRLFGKIEYDPAYQYKVTAFAPGVIDEIYVKRAGQTVKTGDALYDMYSVELYFLEQELFSALEKLPGFNANRPAVGQRYRQWVKDWMWKPTSPPPRKRVRPGMAITQPVQPEEQRAISVEEEQEITAEVGRIRKEIGSLGLTEAEVDQIISRGWPTGIKTELTPIPGIVLKQDAFASMYLNTGDSVFTIADPRYVWAVFEAYESDFPWIKLGQKAEFSSEAYPGEIFTGEVIYLDPYFDDKTRTTRIGVLCSMHQEKLKPGMLVRGTMYATLSSGYRLTSRENGQQEKRLAIPETAPLITGKRSVVYVEVAGKPGTFEGREVLLGPRGKGYYEVRKGLREGEKVVVNGNFKIDSAIQILAGDSMMAHVGGSTMKDLDSELSSMKMDMEPRQEKP